VRSAPRRTRVYLADDHPMFLEAVVEAVRERPDLELVGSAGNGLDAVAGVRELQPDVALLDMRLRGLSGQEVLDQALAERTSTRFLFLSAYLDSQLVYGALARGASGYLSKDMDRETICDAIASVASGETVLSPDVQRELAGAIRHRDVNERPPLTARERMVLALAAEGHSTREIARRLGVASATVKTHLQSIYHKLDAPDRASAVAAAMRRGMLE
jgi:two-component system, NarL family, nitrate/nitrite response regulator NarL